MIDYNEIPDGFYIKGKLSRDPERRKSDNHPLKFSIEFMVGDDKVFYSCVMWGDMAKRHEGLKKGTPVCVTRGWGKPDRYKGPNAVEYNVTEIVVLDSNVVIPEPEPPPSNDFL
jgi:single-stranded DNA-binding protein